MVGKSWSKSIWSILILFLDYLQLPLISSWSLGLPDISKTPVPAIKYNSSIRCLCTCQGPDFITHREISPFHCPLILGDRAFPSLSFHPSKSPPIISLYQNKTSCSLLEQRKCHDQRALLKEERKIAFYAFLKSLRSNRARSFLSLFRNKHLNWLYTLNRSFLRCCISRASCSSSVHCT